MSTQKRVLNDEPTRQFGGKLTGFASKAERVFETRHLKNYLKGNEFFPFGYKTNKEGMRVKQWFSTQVKWN